MGGGGVLCVWGVVLETPAKYVPASPSSVKPDAPRLYPDVDFSEDDPLEATVHWAPPVWPPHKVLVCQFYYQRCQGTAWTLVSVRGPSSPILLQAGSKASSPNQRPSPEPVPHLFLESVPISHKRPVCCILFS